MQRITTGSNLKEIPFEDLQPGMWMWIYCSSCTFYDGESANGIHLITSIYDVIFAGSMRKVEFSCDNTVQQSSLYCKGTVVIKD